MEITFETDYKIILNKIDKIDPIDYCKTRNYIDGSVTYLSPYISRGVISTKQILQHVLSKGYNSKAIEHFIKELCWRDYFQRLAQVVDVNIDIKQCQADVTNTEISNLILTASTSIEGIDCGIQQLYNSGYMHNHCRMYTAMLVCNIAKSYWFLPAKWMYFHLLDGDWASNSCSWQWVAGANSSKKYFANQENINKYTYTNQTNTFLDISYEELAIISVPDELMQTVKPLLETNFPVCANLNIDSSLPTYIFNYYNLDPNFGKEVKGNKVLLIEPEHFNQYPISDKCMKFMLDLSNNISDIQVFVGSFESLKNDYYLKDIFYKEHPLNSHYTGFQIEREWIVEDVKGYYPSFFAYWKKIEKVLQ